MNAKERREKIITHLENESNPISATSLAKILGVSRQVIVNDVAFLRAEGKNILSFARGYMLEKNIQVRDFRFMTSFRNQLPVSETFLENQFYDFFIYNADLDLSNFKLQESEVSDVKYVSPYEIKTMAEKGLFHPRTEWIKVLYNYIAKF